MDPISDMFIRLKNAQRARHATLRIPYSRYKFEIMRTLSRLGFVGNIERKGKRVKKYFEAELLYRDGAPAVRGVTVYSTPSRRLYSNTKNLKPSARGGVVVLSTSQGVMDAGSARKAKIGGQLIAEVW